VALDTETDRATPNVACTTVPDRSTPVRGLVAVRTVCERVRLSLGLRIDAGVGVGSWTAGETALVGWDWSADALATMEGCRGRSSHIGSSPWTCGRHGLGKALGAGTIVISSKSESKLRSDVGLDVRESEGVSG
jgi:hypothetical protein